MTRHEYIRAVASVGFLVVQVLLLFGLFAKGYLDFMRSVAVATSMWIIYSYLEIKYRFYMDNYVRMMVMVAIITDGFFGYYLSYYVTSFVFDKLQHFFGTYVFALFAYVLAAQLVPGQERLSRWFEFIFIACLGISIGTVYEIAEFLVDQFANPIIASQPSLFDTNLDLICDIMGALAAAVQTVFTRFPVLKRRKTEV